MRLAVLAVSVALIGCGPASVPATVAPIGQVAPAAPGAAEPAAAQTSAFSGLARPFARTEDDYANLAGSSARTSGLPAFSGKLANWPITGTISSQFGPRWGGFHTGLDIAAPQDTPVLAVAAGQVMVVGKPYLAYGDTATMVIIAHGNDLATMYVHLTDGRPPIVKVGQHVKAGEVIAYCGSTGFSTGPHLHFMTIISGRAVDPIPYLP